MDLLGWIYGGIAILFIVILALLFLVKNNKVNSMIMIIITTFSILIALLSVLAMPSNFVVSKIVTGLIAAISLIGCCIRFGQKNYQLAPKILVTISVVGTYIYMLFYM